MESFLSLDASFYYISRPSRPLQVLMKWVWFSQGVVYVASGNGDLQRGGEERAVSVLVSFSERAHGVQESVSEPGCSGQSSAEPQSNGILKLL